MKVLEYQIEKPLHFNWVGKFESPDANWVHMTRDLIDYELILMTAGCLHIAIGDEEYDVQEGEYLLCPPTHNQHGTAPSACSFYWLHFSYHDFENDHRVVDENALVPVGDDARILIPVHGKLPRPDRLIILMKQLQDCSQKYRNIQYNGFLVSAILSEVYSQLYLAKATITSKDGQLQLFQDISDYITWRIHENLKISEIAEYFGYNAKYITTFFKKFSGISLKQHILNQKIDLAKAMLTDTNEPVSQIGYRIGFADNHNFSNAFKKLTGFSPSEYRNTYATRTLFHK